LKFQTELLFSTLMELETKHIMPILGHHGTYKKNVVSIIENGFWESEDHNMWFGDGVYFFVPGLTNPIVSAKQYAEDTRLRDNSEEDTCVLEAIVYINNDSFLDLTNEDGLKFFNSYRDEILAKIELIGKKPSTKFEDHDVIKSLRKELGIEFVKGNVYIQLGIQRIAHLRSRIPNVTIFVVNNPITNIEKASIKLAL
jgi:hypothetical protein